MNSCIPGGMVPGQRQWIEVHFIQTEGKMVVMELGGLLDFLHYQTDGFYLVGWGIWKMY
jgi:UDP-N-acetyl-D-mannosaminuronic acid transferase (WecB/TagA/CpsF family)